MWFEDLTGFAEGDVVDVAAQFDIDGEILRSKVNGRSMRSGRFEVVSLTELRRRAAESRDGRRLSVREVVDDVQSLHLDRASAGALFQVASQFNTLEMVSPTVTPEDGIGIYEHDGTQGPACAMACGAATIVRNYLVDVDGLRGQSADRQIDCLAGLADALDIDVEMSNGYAFPTNHQLDQVAAVVASMGSTDREGLLGELAIGMVWDTEVTLTGGGHAVTQAYCSALPVAYSPVPVSHWEPFARLVLDAAYEATLAAAVVNAAATDNRRVFLTMLGGGVFGNRTNWIVEAIERALRLFSGTGLDVAIVSHRRPNADIGHLVGA